MRFLIFASAVMAYATGAPSGAFLSPLTPAAVLAPATVYLATAPATVSPGDLQAAIIDANVQAQDLIRAAADRERELSEQAIQIQKEKAIEENEKVRLRAEQALWENEEQRWKALEASQLTQAKLEGEAAKIEAEAAKNAEAFVKSTLISPIVPGIPIAYVTPGIIAPLIKPGEESKEAASSSQTTSSQAEDVKSGSGENQKLAEEPAKVPEATAQTEESVKSPEATSLAEESADTSPAEGSANGPEATPSAETSPVEIADATPILKTTIIGGQSVVTQSLSQTHPSYLALSYISPHFKISDPIIPASLGFVHPGAKFFSSSVIHTPGQVPTVVKTIW